MKFITDTHCLIWYLQDSPRLSQDHRELFEQAENARIVVPTIVLAELLHISRKVKVALPFEKILASLEEMDNFTILPLTTDILKQAIPLNQLEMHDALIVATAKELNLPLMTADKQILQSNLVKFIKVK